MLKIKEVKLYDNTTVNTIYFKAHTEQQKKVEKYLESINADIICTTYLENGKAYIDYIKEK